MDTNGKPLKGRQIGVDDAGFPNAKGLPEQSGAKKLKGKKIREPKAPDSSLTTHNSQLGIFFVVY